MQTPSGTDARRQATLHKIGYQELSTYATIYGKEQFFLMGGSHSLKLLVGQGTHILHMPFRSSIPAVYRTGMQGGLFMDHASQK